MTRSSSSTPKPSTSGLALAAPRPHITRHKMSRRPQQAIYCMIANCFSRPRSGSYHREGVEFRRVDVGLLCAIPMMAWCPPLCSLPLPRPCPNLPAG
ncbi:hypothetical protein BDN72DRAFT_674212 [Pluteus cervinus]|uniref:Uncharacterized protein n=1 Tax=Pluteus cervinus TaxID=181527 RepID=A0ACD2ZZJ0_9AGAR|nr:hypothetical protein BDN72DRAFT_674212 [Pluteus cervinus]